MKRGSFSNRRHNPGKLKIPYSGRAKKALPEVSAFRDGGGVWQAYIGAAARDAAPRKNCKHCGAKCIWVALKNGNRKRLLDLAVQTEVGGKLHSIALHSCKRGRLG